MANRPRIKDAGDLLGNAIHANLGESRQAESEEEKTKKQTYLQTEQQTNILTNQQTNQVLSQSVSQPEDLKAVTLKLRPSQDRKIELYAMLKGVKKQDAIREVFDTFFALSHVQEVMKKVGE